MPCFQAATIGDKGNSVSGKELVECVQWDWHRGQLSVEMVCLMEKANVWKWSSDASKENKGQFVGMAWSEGILYFVSEVAIVYAFLSTCSISTHFLTCKAVLPFGNKQNGNSEDGYSPRSSCSRQKKLSAGMPSPRPQDDRGHHLIHMGILAC